MKNAGRFIGIDGGGTHSKAVMVDRTLQVIRRTEGDCLNYYSICFDRARENFRMLIERLLDGDDLSNIQGVFIGMSAIDREETSEVVARFAGDLFPNARIYMHSDLYIALMSLTLGEPGIILVSGTGTMALAVDAQGREYLAGGYGYLLGDQGSAFSIAEAALRLALKAFDGVARKTALQEAMLSHFQLRDHRDIIKKVYTSDNPRKCISSFAVEVTSAAMKGDDGAMRVLCESARYLADVTTSLIRQIDSSCLDRIGIYGGVFENDGIVNRLYRDYMAKSYPALRIERPCIPSELGAAIAAMKRAGIPVRPEMLKSVEGM